MSLVYPFYFCLAACQEFPNWQALKKASFWRLLRAGRTLIFGSVPWHYISARGSSWRCPSGHLDPLCLFSPCVLKKCGLLISSSGRSGISVMSTATARWPCSCGTAIAWASTGARRQVLLQYGHRGRQRKWGTTGWHKERNVGSLPRTVPSAGHHFVKAQCVSDDTNSGRGRTSGVAWKRGFKNGGNSLVILALFFFSS